MVRWRRLTVSETSRVCTPDVAQAYRVSWGVDETLVVYRGLAHAASRSFLGHQTKAATRWLVGDFDREGNIKPLLTLDE
jgi:hypothetical protein